MKMPLLCDYEAYKLAEMGNDKIPNTHSFDLAPTRFFIATDPFFLRHPQPSTISTAEMKHFDGPPFKVSRWHNLWRSNIPNLYSLKQQAGVSGFVAIDAEPWGTSLTDIVEIGVAFIPPIDIEALQDPPRSLDSLQTRYPIQVCNIRVANRKQGQRVNRESFIGPTRIVEPEAVHETLQRLFQSFRDILGPQASLALIGFDLAYEFRIMSSTYLGITENVSSWSTFRRLSRMSHPPIAVQACANRSSHSALRVIIKQFHQIKQHIALELIPSALSRYLSTYSPSHQIPPH